MIRRGSCATGSLDSKEFPPTLHSTVHPEPTFLFLNKDREKATDSTSAAAYIGELGELSFGRACAEVLTELGGESRA